MVSRLLLAFAGMLAAWAFWLTAGGGIDLSVAGRRISSNDPVRPLLLATLFFVAYTYASGSHHLHHRWARLLDRIGDGRLACVCSAGLLVLGIAYATTVGIASDGYGYVSEADLWLRGNLFIAGPWAAQAPWPDAESTFAPLGYRPAAGDHASIVPVYSAGLPLMMALAKLVGGHELMFWVVPTCGALLIWLTYGVGTRLGSSRAGLIAAWLVATSPPVLAMLMQPMSDVPVAAAWTAAIFLAMGRSSRQAAMSGSASALAILIRPNLVGLAAVIACWWLLRPSDPAGGVRWRAGLRTAVVYSLCALPGVVTTALINQSLYGSPLTSGYGDLSRFFAWANVFPNVQRYFGWFVESQGWIAVVGIVALLLPIRAVWPWARDRAPLVMVLACLAVLVFPYLAYIVFDEWQFLRFLLAAWPLVMLGVAAVAMALYRVLPPAPSVLVTGAIFALGAQGLQHARTSGVFDQWREHRRSVEFAQLLAREFPADSVFYALNHSGTLRHYAGRTTIRADLLNPDWLDRSVEWLRARGRPAYLVLEEWELDWFRTRYQGQPIAASLDERLKLVYGTRAPYRVYDLGGDPSGAPRHVETGEMRAFRSAPPHPAAFAPQLEPVAAR